MVASTARSNTSSTKCGASEIHGSHASQDVPDEGRTLSGACDSDPCHGWIVELIQDAHAGRPPFWPKHSMGMQMMFEASRLRRGRDGTPSCSTAPALDLQETLKRRKSHQADARLTAIRVHRELTGLISAAQGIICTPDWFHDPSKAVFVCADKSEAAEVDALLRRDYDHERGEDLLESARDLAEGLMAPSPTWRYSGPPPVVLASEIQPGASWREVFLAPGCRGLQADQLLPAVGAARVGVHLVAAR
jgi:hypothetical protein